MFFDIFVQAIGFIAFGVIGLGYLQKKKTQILIFNIISSLLLALHYYFLGGLTGALCNLLGAAVLTFIYFYEKFGGKNTIIKVSVILVVLVVIGFLSWQGFDSLLPIAASAILMNSFLLKDEQKIRLAGVLGAALYLIYAILYSSYSGMIGETIIIIATIIGIIKYRSKPQLKAKSKIKKSTAHRKSK